MQSAHLECLPVSLRTSRWYDGTKDLAPGVLVSAAARGENMKENKRHLSASEHQRQSTALICSQLPEASQFKLRKGWAFGSWAAHWLWEAPFLHLPEERDVLYYRNGVGSGHVNCRWDTSVCNPTSRPMLSPR